MEPHLYLNRGKKHVLLVRYFDKLHFVNLDHRLNYKVRSWFLERPRTEKEMDEKGLVRESVLLKDIRGIAAGGTGRGMVVQFYLKEGKKRYELFKDCDLADMSALFAGLESFDPPKKDSNWHDPRLARQDPRTRTLLWTLGALLNIVSVLGGFFIWAAGFETPWLCWISLLCIPVSIALYCCFPDYFIILSEKRKYGQKKSVRKLIGPFVCPVGMIMGAVSCYEILSIWKAWLFGTIAVLALAAILYMTVPFFRAGDKMFALVLAGALLSGGPVLALNSLLEAVPAQEIRTEVVDKEKHGGGKGPDIFELLVMLDGEEAEIPVGGETYRETEIGEIVTVEIYDGAFGIGYANID